MKTFRTFSGPLIASTLAFASQAHALLSANDLQGSTGKVNLTYSRLIVQVGPQWIDVEEEAELQVHPDWNSSSKAWIAEGTFVLPKGAAITGCMLWNDDTLLMGKLRGKSSAKAIFDSIVPPHPTAVARDPLLVEQLDDTTYGLHLYPFAPDGSRRLRLRYLVPLLPGDSGTSLKPLMAKSVNGGFPAQFRLRMKGDTKGLVLSRSGIKWPVDLPSNDLLDLATDSDIQLSWPTKNGPKGALRAIRGHVDSGAWKGDYVLYTGKVPDSILTKTSLRSETVVLWKWIQPGSFVSSCGYYYQSTYACLTDFGSLAVQQATRIGDLADHLAGSGNKVGLIADQGLTDSVQRFPLADSGSREYRQMRQWLGGITPTYLTQIITPAQGGSTSWNANDFEAGRSRASFRTDIHQALSLYSRDSGIVRHILVVTVGPQAPSLYLEPYDTASLPKGVSISSSQLDGGSHWDYAAGQYVEDVPKPAQWPGVDLVGTVKARPGGTELSAWNGVAIPRSRDSLAGRLSIKTSTGTVSRRLVVRNLRGAGMVASLDVHGIDAAKSVNWTLYDENGTPLRSWDATPDWMETSNDSVVPRLWMKSESPMSPVFEDKELAPIFGVVDPFYSLLAIPSDSVGRERQSALEDSGVPFLSSREIFARQGYGGDNTGIEDRANRSRASLKLSFLAASRLLKIDLEGLGASSLEIRDLRGRILASWSKGELEGRRTLEWRIPSSAARGLLLVSAKTSRGTVSDRVFVD